MKNEKKAVAVIFRDRSEPGVRVDDVRLGMGDHVVIRVNKENGKRIEQVDERAEIVSDIGYIMKCADGATRFVTARTIKDWRGRTTVEEK